MSAESYAILIHRRVVVRAMVFGFSLGIGAPFIVGQLVSRWTTPARIGDACVLVCLGGLILHAALLRLHAQLLERGE